MEEDICPVCTLPRDLCICQEIAKEEQTISVKMEKRRYGKEYTVITGIDPKDVDLRTTARKLKSRLACGGTAKEGRIELQGDHRFKIKDLLVSMGFPENNIEVERPY